MTGFSAYLVTGMDVKSIMRSSRFPYWHAVRACTIPLAVGAALLLLGGVANSAPLEGPTQTADAAAPVATTTALTVSPVSPVAQSTRVTLTATITPATAVGTVQFKDLTTNIGNPVTVSNQGTASGSTSRLAPGLHSLTAVFTPADPAAFGPSMSSALPLTVTGSGAGVSRTGTHQRSGLSLDVQVSILGDRNEKMVVLDGCPPVAGVLTPVHSGTTVLDGRSSVRDNRGLLGNIVSITLG